jgi:hypothetical protein
MSNASTLDEFIQLDRTFLALALDKDTDDDTDLTRLLRRCEQMRWPDLLREHRVILLAEAGSGKTEEVRQVARKLRQVGKPAFFIRIEYVNDSFEDAFEEGSFEEFNNWAASGAEGWLFLDSVDESRLKDPRDFERAIKRVGRLLQSVRQQAHIVITGRTSAWRPKTDLMLCRNELPYQDASTVVDKKTVTDANQAVLTTTAENQTSPPQPFKIVTLEDLQRPQIETFLQGKKVKDPQAFLEEVERKDVWLMTSRPQDLSELVELWNERQKIGSRLELIQRSIERRLEERDQNRAEERPISIEKLRTGACLVAAAATLTQQSAIRVPDGTDHARGIAVKEVLTDWDDRDCATLLSRPIFDEGIYGTVRFHHRSVREYLTAEWLYSLLVNQDSRSRIENLFFRLQYDVEVVVPTMRPVLPWLALLDSQFLTRTRILAPEILLEGGDPSQIPYETRSEVLRQACVQLAKPAHAPSLTNYSAVQRFANIDLTNDIKELLGWYRDVDDVSGFLLRMVWLGKIIGVAGEAKHLALTSRAKYTRIAAFRALAAVGSAADQAEVRLAFLCEDEPLDRAWLVELLPNLPQNVESVQWLLGALRRVSPKPRFDVDGLSDPLSQLVAAWPLHLLNKLVEGLKDLLETPPVIELGYCAISKHYSWLAVTAAEALLRLIETHNPSVLAPIPLSILRKLPRSIYDYGDQKLRNIQGELSRRITKWPALHHALFWHDIAETRASHYAKTGERLTNYWSVTISGGNWAFGAEAFDTFCDDIATRPLLDDKLVALTLAFAIYQKNNCPDQWRLRLESLTTGEPELNSTLDKLLHPPATEQQEQRMWEEQAKRDAEQSEANKREWKTYLDANIEVLCNLGTGSITQAQWDLHEQMREVGDHSQKWTEGNWRSLIPEFGEQIALAFRDGVVNFWRCYRPELRSEGAKADTTPINIIFGLTGLAIEAREDTLWATRLSSFEAEVATRFALYELNGFPDWLPSLYAVHPQTVINVVIAEIDYELTTETAESTSTYVLSDVSWTGDWMWDSLAPLILARLEQSPKNVGNLRYMLNILQGSKLDDLTVTSIASRQAKAIYDSMTAPLWFAVWVGVEPVVAISALETRLAEIGQDIDKTEFVMHFITELLGSRRERRKARLAYRTIEHMKTLYLLTLTHVREEEDNERAGKGAYSPDLRDDAQEARHALFAFILETPGEEAFRALMDISCVHPNERSGEWMAFHAKQKAERDADITAWSPNAVRKFNDFLKDANVGGGVYIGGNVSGSTIIAGSRNHIDFGKENFSSPE